MLTTILVSELAVAAGQTLYMVFMSTLWAVMLGLPLGTLLYVSHAIKPSLRVYRSLSGMVNGIRAIPFVILLVILIPFTRLLIGTSIGIHAAIVPLTIGAVPFLARLIDNAYRNLPQGLLETGYAMGANTWQIICHIFLPEARSAIIQAITVTMVTLVNYSAMAGTVGGGGLGDLAIRYGYQRFNVSIMILTVIILMLIVQSLQWIGDRLAHYFRR